MARDTSAASNFERFLVAVGAVASVVAAVRIWPALSMPVFGSAVTAANPLPGLYVAEMLLLSGAGLIGVFREWTKISWAAAGACLAFGVMGAWSIGLVFLPTGLLFAFAAMLATRRLQQNLVVNLVVGLVGGAIQIGVMLMVVRLATAMTSDLPGLTPTPWPGPAVGSDALVLWSPDGRYYATADLYGGIVGEVNGQRVFTASMANGVSVWRWTSDGRFVIFRWRHPHHNSYTYVFDTQTWNLIWSTPGCKFIGQADLLGWENRGDYPVAVSLTAPRFLMMNGKLIDLPEVRQTALLPEQPVGQRAIPDRLPQGEASAWSPDGSALAFVVQVLDPPGFALYSAHGDGSQVRQLTTLINCPKSLQWSSDNEQVMVAIGPCDSDVSTLRYVWNLASGQLQVEQVIARTPTPPVPETVATAMAAPATESSVNTPPVPPPTAQPMMPAQFPSATP